MKILHRHILIKTCIIFPNELTWPGSYQNWERAENAVIELRPLIRQIQAINNLAPSKRATQTSVKRLEGASHGTSIVVILEPSSNRCSNSNLYRLPG
jgi:hypothetical protein